ncbi:hypothetical protein Vadar_027092 [Vaccinium darrowii]|uniref:Uncharacterized protein n=1 Tax=Vaccinium darrowii TaxID=229202 RepID=A0ACB7XK52_9ERIC|nr:hypothetical protein Vadar_027092 [Vaccinium darrowii]
MDEYIDEIRGYEQQLEAVGYHVDDDDLVFYALKGLPEEYRPVRSALNAKGDVVFNDLATILKNEESQILKDEGRSAPKVFLANQKYSMTEHPPQSYNPSSTGTEPQMNQNGISGAIPQLCQTPMYQNSQSEGSYFPMQYNRNNNSGQNNRGGRKPNFGQNNKVECQICGKTNHTAMYCYHRQNLQYQPPTYVQSSNSRRGMASNWNGSTNYVSNNAQNSPMMSYNTVIVQRPFSGNNGQIFSSHNNGSAQPNLVAFPNTVQLQGRPGFVTVPTTNHAFVSPAPRAFITTAPAIRTGFSVNGQTEDGSGCSGGGQSTPIPLTSYDDIVVSISSSITPTDVSCHTSSSSPNLFTPSTSVPTAGQVGHPDSVPPESNSNSLPDSTSKLHVPVSSPLTDVSHGGHAEGDDGLQQPTAAIAPAFSSCNR